MGSECREQLMDTKLLTQSQARYQARQLNADREAGFPIAIAVPVPFGCWGGTEDGWTVVYTPAPAEESR